MTRDASSFCSHDIYNSDESNTFLDSISRVGEGEDWISLPPYAWENWAEVPLQREKLLGLAQRTMNREKAKVAVSMKIQTLICFLSDCFICDR